MQHFFSTDAYTPLVIRHSATYTKMSATYTNVSLLWRLLCSNAASMSLPCFTHFFCCRGRRQRGLVPLPLRSPCQLPWPHEMRPCMPGKFGTSASSLSQSASRCLSPGETFLFIADADKSVGGSRSGRDPDQTSRGEGGEGGSRFSRDLDQI